MLDPKSKYSNSLSFLMSSEREKQKSITSIAPHFSILSWESRQ